MDNKRTLRVAEQTGQLYNEITKYLTEPHHLNYTIMVDSIKPEVYDNLVALLNKNEYTIKHIYKSDCKHDKNCTNCSNFCMNASGVCEYGECFCSCGRYCPHKFEHDTCDKKYLVVMD